MLQRATEFEATPPGAGDSREEYFATETQQWLHAQIEEWQRQTADLEAIANRISDEAERYVREIEADTKIANAILGRRELHENWPLDIPVLLSPVQTSAWPVEISIAEVQRVYERIGDVEGVETLHEFLRNPLGMQVPFTTDAPEVDALPPVYGSFGQVVSNLNSGSPRLNPWKVAVVLDVRRQIEDARKLRAFAVDAGKHHHGFVSAWRDEPKDLVRHSGGKKTVSKLPKLGRIELIAPKGFTGAAVMQLTLPDMNLEGVIQQLQNWRGAFGLRNWVAMQEQLSVEGHRLGFVTWKLDRHLESLGYGPKERRRKDVRSKALELVRFFTKVELAVYDENGDVRIRRALFQSIDTAERRDDEGNWNIEGLTLAIHPFLYQGVRMPSPVGYLPSDKTPELGTNWFPQSATVAKIDHVRFPHAHALALILAMRWRWNAGKGQYYLDLEGSSLLSAAGITYTARRSADIWRKLTATLDELIRANALGSYEWLDGSPSTRGRCRLIPAQWQLDRVEHGVTPIEKWKAAIPETGADLAAWRKENGLSQGELADRLGVGERTIQRAERAEALPPKLFKALKANLEG